MTNLAGYVGAFYMSSDAGVAVNNESVDSDVGSGGLTFTLANKWVDVDGLAVALSDGTAVQIEQNYTFNPNGMISFTSAQTPPLEVDYTYYPSAYPAGGFTNWSIDVTADALDSTNFTSTGWRTFIAGLATWTGSAEKHWTTDLIADNMAVRAVLRFYTDETNSDYYTGWGLINGISTNEAVDTLVENTVSFTGQHALKIGAFA